MKVLVTGGTGVIGRELVARLRERGAAVRVLREEAPNGFSQRLRASLLDEQSGIRRSDDLRRAAHGVSDHRRTACHGGQESTFRAIAVSPRHTRT